MSQPMLQADIDGYLTLAGIDCGGFQTVQGGEESAEVVDDFPPGALFADKGVSRPTLSNLTFGRTMKVTRDQPIRNQLHTGMTGTGVRFFRDENRNIVDKETYSVVLIRAGAVDGDTNGGTAKATWTVEVAATGRV